MAIPRFAVWGVPKVNNLIKHVVCFFNIVILASAIFLITWGAIALTDIGCTTMPVDNKIPAMIAIATGSVLCIFIAVGCCGAIKDSIPFLISYSMILAIVFVLEVVAAILVIIYKDEIRDTVRSRIDEMIEKYKYVEKDKLCIDRMQQRMKCCGSEGPGDWAKTASGVPESCCYEDKQSLEVGHILCKPFHSEKKYLYADGCVEKVIKQIDTSGNIYLYCAAGLSVVKLFSACLACCLSMRLRSEPP